MIEHQLIWKPHVTVAAIAERQGRFLMVEEIVSRESRLNQPAGHLEDNESLIEAVRRECLEETGWVFRPLYLVGIYSWKHPGSLESFLRFTFAGELEQHFPDQPLDDGIVAARWMSKQEITRQSQRLRSPLVIQSINDYLSGKNYPLSLLAVVS